MTTKSNRPTIHPQSFRNALPPYFRHGFIQHDAGEFIKILLDQIENSAGKDYPIVKRNFEGKMQSKIYCEECKEISELEESFVDLSIPLYDEERKSLK